MILEEFIKVKITKLVKQHYIDKNYKIDDITKYLMIKPIDLSKFSRIKITVICDICEKNN